MRKVKILTDTTCDLTNSLGENILEKLDVDYVSLYVSFNEEIYQDWKEIKPVELYKKVEEKKQLPKTSCASPQDYIDFFKKYIDEGYDIVFTGIGGNLSGGYRSATIAASEFEEGRVYVVDSANLSTGIGLQVLKACKYRDQGMSAKEIADKLSDLAKKVKSKFVVDTLDYLHKGGRCSGMTRIVGTLLHIKPIIYVEDGKLVVGQKARGKKKGLDAMFECFAQDFKAGNIDMDHIMITHTMTPEEAEYLLGKMLELGVPEEVIMRTEANCVISCHCGQKTIGILYITK